MDLAKRRTALLADHAAMQKYDPHWKAEAAAGRPLAERPIAFLCDDEVCVVGECVGKVREGLAAFVQAAESNPRTAEKLRTEPAFAQALAKAKRVSEDTSEEIRVPQQTWSACLYALNEMGVDVVLTDGTYED